MKKSSQSPLPSKEISTVGIDARLSGKEHAGIGRYIENLLIELIGQYSHIFNWVIFFHHSKQYEAIEETLSKKREFTENISGSKKNQTYNTHNHQQASTKIVFTPIRHYSLSEQTLWPSILQQHSLDLLHIPHFNIPLLYTKPITITIHDLLWHQQIGPQATTLPSWKYYLKYAAYRIITTQAINRAKKIFVPTQTVKNDLAEFKPTASSKIQVTKEGIGVNFLNVLLNENDALSQKSIQNKISSKQLVYVGSLYPHKNIERVLLALTKLSNYRLKIVCARNVFVSRVKERVKKLQLTKQVEFTGYLSDDELVDTIQNSFCLVQPSKSEGFGLTAIEAMACSTPVIASDLEVFHEIYQDAPEYFCPDSTQQLIDAIKKLEHVENYHQAATAGCRVAQQYSWKKMAKKTISGFREVLEQ